jgi:hypothetical protein
VGWRPGLLYPPSEAGQTYTITMEARGRKLEVLGPLVEIRLTLKGPQPGAPADWEIGAMLVLSFAPPVDAHGAYDPVVSGAGSPVSVPFRVAPPPVA